MRILPALASRLPLTALAALMLVRPAPPAGAAPLDLRLPNGSRILAVSGSGPLTLTARIDAGSRSDPPGKEGLAELTAACLTVATHVHDGDGDLARAVGQVAGSAFASVGTDAMHLVLSDVTDARGALSLAIEMLAMPSFPTHVVLAERARLARIVLDDERSAAFRRSTALDSLLVHPWTRADGWTVLALTPADCQLHHEARYRPDRLVLVLSGEGIPANEELEAMAREVVGTWVVPGMPAPARPSPRAVVRSSPQPMLVRGGPASASVAFPVPAQGGAAAVLALRAALEAAGDRAAGLEVTGEATTVAGDLVAEPGTVLVVDGEVTDPAAAVAALLDGLRSVERPGDRRRGARVPVEAPPMTGEGAGIAIAESLGDGDAGVDPLRVSRLPLDVAAADVARAARALRSGPRAVVGQLPTGASDAAWRAAFPRSVELTLGLPAHPADRACRVEGRAWIDAAVAAHGGQGLLDLARVTRICKTLEGRSGGSSLPLYETRVDVELSTGDWRQEDRPYQYRGGPVVTVSSGEQRELRNDEIGIITLDALDHAGYDGRRRREVINLLRRAASPEVAVRSAGLETGEGTVHRVVEIADPETGVTRVAIDAAGSLLAGIEYELLLNPHDGPTWIRDEPGDWQDVSGLVLPGAVVTRSSSLGDRLAILDSCAWSFPAAASNLGRFETDERDIRRIIPGTD